MINYVFLNLSLARSKKMVVLLEIHKKSHSATDNQANVRVSSLISIRPRREANSAGRLTTKINKIKHGNTGVRWNVS